MRSWPRWTELAVVSAAAGVAGIGTYALLIIVARNLTVVDYSQFATFWAFVVTIGLGAFLPLEQESSRESAGARGGTKRLARTAFVVSGSLAIAIILIIVIVVVALGPSGAIVTVGAALALAVVASALQFPVRGLLAGAHQSISYSAIVGVEGILRIALPLLIVVVGASSVLGFAVAVAIATVVGTAAVVASRSRSPFEVRSDVGYGRFITRLLRLMVAAVAIQLLLNSAMLLAHVVTPDRPALAGQVLATLSLARVPVFVYQVGQILYLPRIASAMADSRPRTALRAVGIAVLLSAIVSVMMIVVLIVSGDAIVGLLFGPELVLESDARRIIAVGVGVFLVALVLSDGAVGMRMHGFVSVVWVVALGSAAVTTVVVSEPVTRVIAPLLVGSATALVLLAVSLAWRVRGLREADPRSAD